LKIGADRVRDPGRDGVRRLQVQAGRALTVELDQVEEPRLREIVPQLDFRLFDARLGQSSGKPGGRRRRRPVEPVSGGLGLESVL
jgi:hypothetical protein